MSHRASFSATVVVTLVSRWLTLALTIATGVVVARALGPGAKGLFVLTFLLLNQTASMGTFGIPHALIYFLGSGRIDRSAALGHFLACSLGSALALLVPYVLVVHLAGERLFPGVPAATLDAIGLLLFPALLVANGGGLLRGLGRLDLFNLVALADALLRLGLLLGVLGALHAGLRGVVVVTALASVVTGSFVAALCALATGERPRFERATFAPLVAYGMKSYLTVMLQMTERKIDLFLLAWLLPAESAAWQIGLYSTAVSLAELPRNVAGAVSTVLLPRIAATDTSAHRTIVPQVSRNLIAVNIVFAALLALGAGPLIELLYGPAFAPCYLPFVILLPGVVFAGVWNVFEAELVGIGRPLKLSAFAGFTLTLNVALNVVMIPRWGILGAAATSGITYSLLAVLLVMDYRARNRGVGLRELLIVSRDDVVGLARRLRRLPAPPEARTAC